MAAVAMKRAEGAALADLAAERLAAGRQQLEDTRRDFVLTAQRFGKGGALWAERGWGWEEPDWAAAPETWSPVAKLLWLHCRLVELQSRASMLSLMASHPYWCPDCHEGERRPEGWTMALCADHFADGPVIRALATHLGFREEGGDGGAE